MHVAVLIPGIMGTRLRLPAAASGEREEEVWPPTPLETKFGYGRVEKLLDERLTPTKLIGNVLCYSFYRTIANQLSELGFSPNGGAQRLVEFPYDWRRDNFLTADLLAAKLDELHAKGASEISLIGHSMGGLVARLVMESGRYEGRPWFDRIMLFTSIATPHLGAPLALARIFGVDGTLGLSGSDFARLAADRRYPSGYQLIPAPGERAVWNLASQDVDPLDVYRAPRRMASLA